MRLLDPKSSPLIRHEAQLQPHPAPDKELNSRQVSKAQRTRWRSAHRGTDKGARPHRAPPACAACPTGPGPLPNNTLQLATTCAPGAAAGTPGLLGDLLQRRMRERDLPLALSSKGSVLPHPRHPKFRFALWSPQRALTSRAPRTYVLLCVRRRSQPYALRERGWQRNSPGPAIQGPPFCMPCSAETRPGTHGAHKSPRLLRALRALWAQAARRRRAGGVAVARAGGALCGRGTGRPY